MADRTFEYLLNRMELAGRRENPAEHGYGEARKAVLKHEADLRDQLAAVTAERDGMATEIATAKANACRGEWPCEASTEAAFLEAENARLLRLIDRYLDVDGSRGNFRAMDLWNVREEMEKALSEKRGSADGE